MNWIKNIFCKKKPSLELNKILSVSVSSFFNQINTITHGFRIRSLKQNHHF